MLSSQYIFNIYDTSPESIFVRGILLVGGVGAYPGRKRSSALKQTAPTTDKVREAAIDWLSRSTSTDIVGSGLRDHYYMTIRMSVG